MLQIAQHQGPLGRSSREVLNVQPEQDLRHNLGGFTGYKVRFNDFIQGSLQYHARSGIHPTPFTLDQLGPIIWMYAQAVNGT